jgi:hypothetical protein
MRARADLCRRSGPAARAPGADRRPPSPRAALAALAQGPTDALGGPVCPGTACGARADRSPSGQHRQGPTCPQEATTRGLAPPRPLRLPGPAGLVTGTRPAARRPGARAPPTLLSHLRLQTAAAAGPPLARAPQSRGGPLGLGGGSTRGPGSGPRLRLALSTGGGLSEPAPGSAGARARRP